MSDYQDDLLENDEETVPESKSFRAVRLAFKILLYGASALVWGIVLYVVITTRDAKLFSQMRFSDETRTVAEQTVEKDGTFYVHELHTNVFMNYDGSISVGNVWYCRETGELNLGIRINKKLLKYTDENGAQSEGTPEIVLIDEDGTTYPIVCKEKDEIGRYLFLRISFKGMDLPLKDSSFTPADQPKEPETEALPVLRMFLTMKETGKPLATHFDREKNSMVDDAVFVIFNRDTAYKKVEYDG